VELRRALGVEDAWPVVCEPFTQWVIEDDFPAGRPPWEEVGVQMVDDVVPYELMKLRLLNASHQGLAHWGRLLGIKYAHEAAADADIATWVRAYLEREARATLRSVPGSAPDGYTVPRTNFGIRLEASCARRKSVSAIASLVKRLKSVLM